MSADTARALFARHFGHAPAVIARAPGRVNLIGDHTDYNDGFVLPMAIDRHTWVAARRNDGDTLRVVAGDLGAQVAAISLSGPIRADPAAGWTNYVAGMAALMRDDGVAIAGTDMVIAGNMPQGAGLSSSAALENAVGLVLAALAGRQDFDRTRLAALGQLTEHRFAGCKCGIMDQMVSACAVAGHALLIDCRSLAIRPVPLPDDIAIVIVESGVTRGLVDGAYNARRQQCAAAAKHFGVTALRDVTPDALSAHGPGLDDDTLARARHVVGENLRTLAAVDALATNDLATLGVLMAASHASLRDDFAVTVPAVDTLTDILQQSIGGDGGARMTGGGFGGAVVAMLRRDRLASVIAAVERNYHPPGDAQVRMMHAIPVGGAAIV